MVRLVICFLCYSGHIGIWWTSLLAADGGARAEEGSCSGVHFGGKTQHQQNDGNAYCHKHQQQQQQGRDRDKGRTMPALWHAVLPHPSPSQGFMGGLRVTSLAFSSSTTSASRIRFNTASFRRESSSAGDEDSKGQGQGQSHAKTKTKTKTKTKGQGKPSMVGSCTVTPRSQSSLKASLQQQQQRQQRQQRTSPSQPHRPDLDLPSLVKDHDEDDEVVSVSFPDHLTVGCW